MSEERAHWQRTIAFLAGAGFALSAVWHLAARQGRAPGMPPYAIALFVGVFVVWFPTVIYLQRFERVLRRGLGITGWKYVVAGAPPWLIWLAGFSFVYAIVNFLLFMPHASDASFGIGASGHAMAFYSAAAVINYAAVRREGANDDWECERGHLMGPDEKFCSECGAPGKKKVGLRPG